MKNIKYTLLAAVLLAISCEQPEQPSINLGELPIHRGYLQFSTGVSSRAQLAESMRGRSFGVLGYKYSATTTWATAKPVTAPNTFYELEVACADIREYPAADKYDIVYTNPPYMKATSGKASTDGKKNLARHEVCGDIGDFLASAKRLLKYGGTFYAVYRPDRLTDLICAMRAADIEPKRATFVHANDEKESSMVLIEGKRGGKSGMKLTPPLIIYKTRENKEYSADMEYIMENGRFPDKFLR